GRKLAQRAAKRGAKAIDAAEQREARVHLEQEPVRRLDAHARREAQPDDRERLEQAALAPMRSLEHAQRAGEGEGGAEVETLTDAPLPCGAVQGDDPKPSSGRLDDDGRATVLPRGRRLGGLQRERGPVRCDPQLPAAGAALRIGGGASSLSGRQSERLREHVRTKRPKLGKSTNERRAPLRQRRGSGGR